MRDLTDCPDRGSSYSKRGHGIYAATLGSDHLRSAPLLPLSERAGPVLGPGCAAEGMAVPLGVKELRPLQPRSRPGRT
jgi:hypothetical protein